MKTRNQCETGTFANILKLKKDPHVMNVANANIENWLVNGLVDTKFRFSNDDIGSVYLKFSETPAKLV